MGHKTSTIIKYRKLSTIWLITSFFIYFIGTFFMTKILVIIGVISVLIFLISVVIFWRCPNCNKRLPMRIHYKTNNDIDNIYVCPYCNIKFKD